VSEERLLPDALAPLASSGDRALPLLLLQDQPRDHPLGGDALPSLPAILAARNASEARRQAATPL